MRPAGRGARDTRKQARFPTVAGRTSKARARRRRTTCQDSRGPTQRPQQRHSSCRERSPQQTHAGDHSRGSAEMAWRVVSANTCCRGRANRGRRMNWGDNPGSHTAEEGTLNSRGRRHSMSFHAGVSWRVARPSCSQRVSISAGIAIGVSSMGCSNRCFRQSTMKRPREAYNSRGETEEGAFRAWRPTTHYAPFFANYATCRHVARNPDSV